MSRKLLEREGRQDEIGLSQYNQIGNAVPPPLAQVLGETFEEL
jgi:DNA (cytosine-5)-methyltransferase 1